LLLTAHKARSSSTDRECHEGRSNTFSKSEIAQGRVIVGTATKRPVVAALALRDREIVDAGNAQPRQAVFVELPILVAIAAEPVPAVVVPLIGETNRDTVSRKTQISLISR
jgi:hypothetical protein